MSSHLICQSSHVDNGDWSLVALVVLADLSDDVPAQVSAARVGVARGRGRILARIAALSLRAGVNGERVAARVHFFVRSIFHSGREKSHSRVVHESLQ